MPLNDCWPSNRYRCHSLWQLPRQPWYQHCGSSTQRCWKAPAVCPCPPGHWAEAMFGLCEMAMVFCSLQACNSALNVILCLVSTSALSRAGSAAQTWCSRPWCRMCTHTVTKEPTDSELRIHALGIMGGASAKHMPYGPTPRMPPTWGSVTTQPDQVPLATPGHASTVQDGPPGMIPASPPPLPVLVLLKPGFTALAPWPVQANTQPCLGPTAWWELTLRSSRVVGRAAAGST